MAEHPTIPQFAAERGVHKRTMFRRLLVMHARDRAAALAAGIVFVPYIFRYLDGPWRVNRSRLRAAHAEWFDVPTNEELDGKMQRLERRVEILDAGHRALIGRVRSLADAVGQRGTAAR
jgi:hypothetical protein